MSREALFLLLLLAGCASPLPVRLVDASGQHGSGQITMTGTMHNGRFAMSDSALSCSGAFPSWSSPTITFPVQCSGGRIGTATMSRPPEGLISGTGTIQIITGGTHQFVFGPGIGQ